MTTASIVRSSRIRRKSDSKRGTRPVISETARTAAGRRLSSTSHRAATSTSPNDAKPAANVFPWFRTPIVATRTRSEGAVSTVPQ